MCDIAAIIEALEQITGLTPEALARYQTLIEAAANTVAAEKPAYAALIAAARVNYQIALLQSAGDGVSSFKAGEVSISETKNSAVSAAKEYLTAVEAQYSTAASGEGFAFRSVG